MLPYNKKLLPIARKLRKSMTRGEALLWDLLRLHLGHYRIRRQQPIGNYIVDFYIHHLRLVIEIDGSSHDTEEQYRKDIVRQEELEAMGLTVLRFRENSVVRNTESVIEEILSCVAYLSSIKSV